MGNYAWLQNIEAARILAEVVFPVIKKEIADVTLLIAGQNTEKIGALSGQGITLLDLAIDDITGVKKAYQKAAILVAPLYGPGGTRLKILGAMASYVPVVTTNIGIEGIEAKNGETVLFGDKPEDLANLAIKLLKNEDFYVSIAKNARKLVEKKYDYKSIAEKLSQIYEKLEQKN